jgi:hypothetical protein
VPPGRGTDQYESWTRGQWCRARARMCGLCAIVRSTACRWSQQNAHERGQFLNFSLPEAGVPVLTDNNGSDASASLRIVCYDLWTLCSFVKECNCRSTSMAGVIKTQLKRVCTVGTCGNRPWTNRTLR